MRYIFSWLACVVILSACGGTDTKPASTTSTLTNNTNTSKVAAPNERGAEVFRSQCMTCHAVDMESGKAPPIFAVKDHTIKVYADREAFIKRVATWIKTPDANDVLMPGAVNKFGLMPAMPQINDNDAQAVAAFLFDTNLNQPDWYKAHYEAEHGKAP